MNILKYIIELLFNMNVDDDYIIYANDDYIEYD